MKKSPFNHLNGKHSTADTDVDGIHNNMKGGDYGEQTKERNKPCGGSPGD